MAPLLTDRSLQRQIDEQGYAVVRLLTDAQVGTLHSLYERYVSGDEISDLYESSRHKDYETSRTINESIRDEIAVAGEALFAAARVYGGSFMVKSHTDSTMLPLHQDWSVVDENKYQTLFVWCALGTTTAEDGGLFVLPGSHRYFRSLRSGSYPSDRFYLPAHLHGHVRDIELRPGEAVLYFDSLFHGSYANSGLKDRIVATARLMDKDADLLYFQRANDTQVDVFAADERFYLTHIDDLAKGEMPDDVPRLRRLDYVHRPVTEAALQDKIRQQTGQPGWQYEPLFRDASLQERFDKDGFVVIDFIDHDQVRELKHFYAGLGQQASPSGFQVSLDNDSSDFVRSVTEKIVSVVADSAERHFQDYRIFTASFVSKDRNPMGVVPPHQDWTFVDENRYWSATVWCPLVGVGAANGGLGLIKGSHLLYEHVRPSPSPQYYPPFSHQLHSLFPYLAIQEIEAGQAIVFNNRTLHGSPPNTSTENRVAFGIGITHRDADLRHYYLRPGQERPLIEGFRVEPEFFFRYNNASLSAMHDRGEKPKGLTSLGVFAMHNPQVETGLLTQRIEAAGNEADTSLMERVAPVLDAMATGMDGNDSGDLDVDGDSELPFWKVYTPVNIVREIRYRLGRR